ncbi:DHA3 family tetracycline resistance protein-like MFS transporter [Actinocorallia herbida]|uniref:DHA3 family tetracycline resistance protein-like MFS transporter n=1 Tax=Actinocorallia herbida TaxID=58109 RepID=A0A3N1DCK5_9ACTN|nr:MFS transporter [Actinocorallia herbida]ROO91247.1 DHA3 family tetracycline resistance protein-like MFS transporter [Actinocorallia herbida]
MSDPLSSPANVESGASWRALAPLRTPAYRPLIGSVALSLGAAGMWAVVLVFQVIAISDSALALSAVAPGLTAGMLVFSLAGGIAADRLSKRAVLVAVQALNTAATAAIAVLSLTGTIRLWHLALASVVLGAATAFYYPAYTAYLPSILREGDLLAANGLEGALRPALQQAGGPALAGILVGTYSPTAGAVIVTALYAAAFVLVLFLPKEPPAKPGKGDAGKPSIFGELREGFAFTLRTPWLLWTLLFACLAVMVVMGPVEVLLPFLARDSFADGERMYGLLLTAFGTGAVLGSLAVSSWRLPRRYLTTMILGWGLGNLPLAVLGYTDSFWLMAAALFVAGLTDGCCMVIWGTLLQRRVPPHMLGRIASLDFFVSLAFLPLSIALAGPLAQIVPVPVIFLFAGLLPPVFAVIAVLAGRLPTDEKAHPLT